MEICYPRLKENIRQNARFKTLVFGYFIALYFHANCFFVAIKEFHSEKVFINIRFSKRFLMLVIHKYKDNNNKYKHCKDLTSIICLFIKNKMF